MRQKKLCLPLGSFYPYLKSLQNIFFLSYRLHFKYKYSSDAQCLRGNSGHLIKGCSVVAVRLSDTGCLLHVYPQSLSSTSCISELSHSITGKTCWLSFYLLSNWQSHTDIRTITWAEALTCLFILLSLQTTLQPSSTIAPGVYAVIILIKFEGSFCFVLNGEEIV